MARHKRLYHRIRKEVWKSGVKKTVRDIADGNY